MARQNAVRVIPNSRASGSAETCDPSRLCEHGLDRFACAEDTTEEHSLFVPCAGFPNHFVEELPRLKQVFRRTDERRQVSLNTIRNAV